MIPEPFHADTIGQFRSEFCPAGAREARDFRVQRRVAADNSSANCPLESSSHFAALAQTEDRPRFTPAAKKHPRTKRIQSRAPTPFVQCVRANGGQIEERKPSAFSRQPSAVPSNFPLTPDAGRLFLSWRVREKRIVKRQESRANPVTSHQKTWRLRQNGDELPSQKLNRQGRYQPPGTIRYPGGTVS